MLSQQENETLTRVGRGTPMGELMRRYWIPAAFSHQIAEPATTAGRSAPFNSSAAFMISRGSPNARAVERELAGGASSLASPKSTSIGSSR